jgi:hypothetical protein
VLEVVHVDVAGGEADVGRDPVGELHQLDFQALFAGFFHGGFQRNGEGGGGADLQRCVGGEYRRAEQAEGQGQCFDWVGEQFLVMMVFQSVHEFCGGVAPKRSWLSVRSPCGLACHHAFSGGR